MRRTALLSCLTLAGCVAASGGGTATSAGPAPETMRVNQGGFMPPMMAVTHSDDGTVTGAVPFTVDRSWTALRFAFDSLSLPVAVFDQASHTISSPTVRLRRRLGDTPLSTYLSCGDAQGTSGADTYEVRLTVRTNLVAGEQGTTKVMSLVVADGRPITIAGEYSTCRSTGKLEQAILDITNKKLQQ